MTPEDERIVKLLTGDDDGKTPEQEERDSAIVAAYVVIASVAGCVGVVLGVLLARLW